MPPKHRTVLCVDDDADDQMLVMDTLREIDPTLRVASALNGAEALRFLEDAKKRGILPRLVFVNTHLPPVNGKPVLQHIRKDKSLEDIPVVLLTASAALVNKSWTATEGIEVLTRPVNQLELYKTLKHLLNYCIA